MKLRIYIPSFHFPPTDGGSHLAWGHAKELSSHGHSVEIVYWMGKVDRTSADGVALRKIEGLGPASPLVRYGKSVLNGKPAPEEYFYPLNPPISMRDLPPVDIAFYHYAFSRPWLEFYRDRPERAPHEAKRIVIYQNLESDLYRLRAQRASGVRRALLGMTADRLERTEVEVAELADEAWFISMPDLQEFKRRAGSRADHMTIRYSAPTLDSALFSERKQARAGKTAATRRFGFIGALDFNPNEESAMWILDRVCPVLADREFSGSIEIIGKAPSERVLAKAGRYQFVQVLGFVKDVEVYWRAWDALLCPNLGGSGTRIKVSEAILGGVPAFVNSEAKARTDVNLADNPLVFCSDDPNAWCDEMMGKKSN